MSSWQQVEQVAPALAAAVRARLTAHVHLTLATLRRDGSPRISGTEVVLRDGELWLAGMAGGRKTADLRRDGRLALHSGSDDPPAWTSDAKVAGRAHEVLEPERLRAFAGELDQEPPGSFELFRIDLHEVVLVRLGEPADHLVVEAWHEGRGVSRVERR
jgi:hypothetical protein